MSATTTTYGSTIANAVIDAIRAQVAVRNEVLDAAKRRRDRVRELAHEHDAARATFNSGSVAHGTANAPLHDTDCGVVLDAPTASGTPTSTRPNPSCYAPLRPARALCPAGRGDPVEVLRPTLARGRRAP